MSGMTSLRARIDEIDSQLIALIAQRLSLAGDVVVVKQRENLPVRIPARIEEVIENAVKSGVKHHVPEHLTRQIWQALIEEMCALEEAEIAKQKL